MIKFPAKKGKFHFYLVLSACLPLFIIYLQQDNLQQLGLNLLPSCLPFLLFMWIYLSTSYAIEGDQLHYRSAFIRGKIAISTIVSLEVGGTMWVGLKPALATQGIIIHYNRFDQLYIAPKSNQDLLAALLALNPQIEVNGAEPMVRD